MLKVLCAAAAGGLAYAYFAVVLPRSAAAVAAALLILVEWMGFLSKRGHAHARGAGISSLPLIGLTLLLWPGVALVVGWTFHLDRSASIALASCLASGAGIFGAGRGWGREEARLAVVGIAAVLPLYALCMAIVEHASPLAMALATGGVAVVPLVARATGAWPGGHEHMLLRGSVTCTVVAAFWAAAALL